MSEYTLLTPYCDDVAVRLLNAIKDGVLSPNEMTYEEIKCVTLAISSSSPPTLEAFDSLCETSEEVPSIRHQMQMLIAKMQKIETFLLAKEEFCIAIKDCNSYAFIDKIEAERAHSVTINSFGSKMISCIEDEDTLKSLYSGFNIPEGCDLEGETTGFDVYCIAIERSIVGDANEFCYDYCKELFEKKGSFVDFFDDYSENAPLFYKLYNTAVLCYHGIVPYLSISNTQKRQKVVDIINKTYEDALVGSDNQKLAHYLIDLLSRINTLSLEKDGIHSCELVEVQHYVKELSKEDMTSPTIHALYNLEYPTVSIWCSMGATFLELMGEIAAEKATIDIIKSLTGENDASTTKLNDQIIKGESEAVAYDIALEVVRRKKHAEPGANPYSVMKDEYGDLTLDFDSEEETEEDDFFDDFDFDYNIQ